MIADALYTALSAVAGGRVYPRLAPEGTPAPYLVYWHVSNIDDALYPITVGYQRYRVQIEAWADSYAGIVALRGQVKAAVAAMPELIETGPDMEADYDYSTRLYGWIFDYTFRLRG